MAAFIIPLDLSGRIVTFDLIESENHETVVEVTDHPVETGANVSDHVRPLPERLSLVAYTTNTPIDRNPFTQRGAVLPQRLDIPQSRSPGLLGLISDAFAKPPEAVAQVLTFATPFDAIRETHEVLQELQANGVLCQIVTGLKGYDDMVIERVAAPRNAGEAGVAFGIDVRQLRVVSSSQVAAPPTPIDDVPGGKPLENKGGQGAKPPGDGEDPSKTGSIAHNFLSGKGLI